MLKTELDFSISLFREASFFVFEEKLTTFAELEKVFI